MINFKQREDVLPSTLILIALLILLGGLIFMLVVPSPSVAGIARGNAAKRAQLEQQEVQAKQQAEKDREAVIPQLWTGNPETVSGGILAQITHQAIGDHLAVGSFRPERQVVLTGVTELPYSVQLSGSYGGVTAVLTKLDAPGSKIVLRQVQITSAQTSSQTATNGVTAVVGVSAYIPNDATLLAPPPAAPKKATGGKHG